MNENCEKLIKDMQVLFDRWVEIDDPFCETRKKFWRELLRKLYHSKALNKVELYKQIEYMRGKLCKE